jgi:hypothetical protein
MKLAIRALAAPLLALALALSPAAWAEEPGHGLFAVNVFADFDPGDRVHYSHVRSTSQADPRVQPIVDGSAILLVAENAAGERELEVTLTNDGRARPVPSFPGVATHPLLLILLESTVRNMAELTGGSPFYIRNRMREALWVAAAAPEPTELALAGATLPAELVVVRPFANDPNRSEMGAFADLQLRFVLSEDVPGGIARLEAETGPGPDGRPVLAEIIAFDRLQEEN